MKLQNGSNWYTADLNNYTREFLIDIILDLHQKKKNVQVDGSNTKRMEGRMEKIFMFLVHNDKDWTTENLYKAMRREKLYSGSRRTFQRDLDRLDMREQITIIKDNSESCVKNIIRLMKKV